MLKNLQAWQRRVEQIKSFLPFQAGSAVTVAMPRLLATRVPAAMLSKGIIEANMHLHGVETKNVVLGCGSTQILDLRES